MQPLHQALGFPMDADFLSGICDFLQCFEYISPALLALN